MGIFSASPQDLCKAGDKLRAQGKLKEAVEKYQKALNSENKNQRLMALAALNIGACQTKLKDNAKALDFFERSLDFMTKAIERQLNIKLGEKNKDFFYRTFFAEPIAVQAALNKSVILSVLNQLDKARKVMDSLLKYIQINFVEEEPRFRQQRLNIIAKMVSGKPGADVPQEEVKKKYTELGYNQKEMELDLKSAQ